VEIKIHTGRRAFNAMSSISRKILKINYLHAHDFLNLGGLVGPYPAKTSITPNDQ